MKCKNCGQSNYVHADKQFKRDTCKQFTPSEVQLLKRGRQLGTNDINTLKMLENKGCGNIELLGIPCLCLSCSNGDFAEVEIAKVDSGSDFKLSDIFKEEYEGIYAHSQEIVFNNLKLGVKEFIRRLKEETFVCMCEDTKYDMGVCMRDRIDKLSGDLK